MGWEYGEPITIARQRVAGPAASSRSGAAPFARSASEQFRPRGGAPRRSRCAAELERQLALLGAQDVSHFVQIIRLAQHREARLLNHASALRAIERCMGNDPAHLRGLARPCHERLDRRRGVPAVPLRLDDGVADLERPDLVDERRTDLADDEVVLGTVEQQ